ncbi:MAG: hypothetical protein AAGH65_12185 [Pseudomonadota bacterium]
MTQLLLVSHAGVATALLSALRSIVGDASAATQTPISLVEQDRDLTDHFMQRLEAAVAELGSAGRLLILTDLPGATPHNLAVKSSASLTIPVVTGLNLPMLLRCVNHPELSPVELADKAIDGARQSIFGSHEHAT